MSDLVKIQEALKSVETVIKARSGVEQKQIQALNHTLLTYLFEQGVFDDWDMSLENHQVLKVILSTRVIRKMMAYQFDLKQLFRYEDPSLHTLEHLKHLDSLEISPGRLALIKWIDSIYPQYIGTRKVEKPVYLTLRLRHQKDGGCFRQGPVSQLCLKVRSDFDVWNIHEMVYLSGGFGLTNKPVGYQYTYLSYISYNGDRLDLHKRLSDFSDGTILNVHINTEDTRPRNQEALLN